MRFASSKGEKRSIAALIRDGARYEDDGIRSLNHFFNPRTGQGLVVPAVNLFSPGDWTPEIINLVNAAVQPSPDWILGTGASALNQYSYRTAHDYYFQSLTGATPQVRSDSVALLFETLGRITHHLQDMAQPQHVRNDMHLSSESYENCPANPFPMTMCAAYRKLRAPSAYELWTASLGPPRSTDGYAAVYAADGSGRGVFTSPRSFWTSGGKGIADYTNRNFLSAGTLSDAPPVVAMPFDIKAGDLCARAIPACEITDLDHMVTFYQNTVDDQFRPGTTGVNPYAAGASIFDWDFRRYAPNQQRLYTVNRFTFTYDHSFLLPRAVGYSAGLINYFFRGDIAVGPPKEGIYAIVDHSAAGCGVPCAFRRIKLTVKNTTPDDDIGAGRVWVVIRYHLNTCYKPDLSGEYGGPSFTGEKCRSADEYVAVSAAKSVNAISRAEAQELDFSFLNGVPISASDVFLQVVFRGRLGAEDDAVVVSTIDISEPNFYALTNVTDFVFDGAVQKYFPLGYKNYQTANVLTNIRFAFGQNSAMNAATSVAVLDRLGGGEHAQFAVLMPKGNAVASMELSGDYGSPGEQNPWDTQEFTQDDAGPFAGKYTRTCPVRGIRGMYRQYGLFFVQQVIEHRATLLKENEVVPAGGQTVSRSIKAASGNPKAAVDSRCAAFPTTGYYDFSAMPPLTPATALSWRINF